MKQLRKSEIKELNGKISGFGIVLNKRERIIIDDNIIFVNDNPMFFYYKERIVPTLRFIVKSTKKFLKDVIVDMGAIKFVVNGADIMKPGIVSFDDNIERDDLVLIRDINNKKPLAIGISLFNSRELSEMDSGKVIKNIHHIGDEIWKKQRNE